MPDAAGRRLIVGVGNPLRGDDGAGHAVIQHLQHRNPADVDLLALPGEATQLIEAWTDADWVSVVAASFTKTDPGTIQCFDAAAGDLPAALERSSTHGFGLAEAVALARNVGRLPRHVIVYTIEGENFEPGAPLSAPVAEAASTLARELAGRAYDYGTGVPAGA